MRRGRPLTGEAQSAAERMRRYRAQRKAAGLKAVTRYESPPRSRITPAELDRRIVDARELALHCLAAKKIDSDRRLLLKVQQRLDYWRRNYREDGPPAALDDWTEILSRPWAAIAVFITDPGLEATRLRRKSPFEIVLNPRERKKVYSAFAP